MNTDSLTKKQKIIALISSFLITQSMIFGFATILYFVPITILNIIPYTIKFFATTIFMNLYFAFKLLNSEASQPKRGWSRFGSHE